MAFCGGRTRRIGNIGFCVCHDTICSSTTKCLWLAMGHARNSESVFDVRFVLSFISTGQQGEGK